jgi:hypothetical protein
MGIINSNIDFLNIHFSFLDTDSWLCQKEERYEDVETLASEIIILAGRNIL